MNLYYTIRFQEKEENIPFKFKVNFTIPWKYVRYLHLLLLLAHKIYVPKYSEFYIDNE